LTITEVVVYLNVQFSVTRVINLKTLQLSFATVISHFVHVFCCRSFTFTHLFFLHFTIQVLGQIFVHLIFTLFNQ